MQHRCVSVTFHQQRYDSFFHILAKRRQSRSGCTSSVFPHFSLCDLWPHCKISISEKSGKIDGWWEVKCTSSATQLSLIRLTFSYFIIILLSSESFTRPLRTLRGRRPRCYSNCTPPPPAPLKSLGSFVMKTSSQHVSLVALLPSTSSWASS